jgi:hypothetical protein
MTLPAIAGRLSWNYSASWGREYWDEIAIATLHDSGADDGLWDLIA